MYYFDITEGGVFTFSATQVGKKRAVLQKGQSLSDLKYSTARLYLVKLTSDESSKNSLDLSGCEFRGGTLKTDSRDTYLECFLDQGSYILVVEVDWFMSTL